ncbi:MAG: FAD-binding oxidoreductase [Dehalococcoidales bacterium]|jgi:FAD/FMN-containing dehydrogenase
MIEKAKLAEIVGTDNVILENAVLKAYAKDMSFTQSIKPACVLKPKNAEEIARIVNLARETLTPLVPVSSGPPHFQGDTIPGTGGAIVVDLSEMKKIIHVDRKNRVVMFEPGVNFGELSAAVAEQGLRLNMPLLPRPSKSVAGSLLEREPVLMPKYHWDIADPLACTEVIFGTGETFRTGAAAGSGTLEEQWAAGGVQKEAAGPSAASWYRLIQGSQGTMGIVTWASARCELMPTLEEPFFVGAANLEKILEALHWLLRLRLVNECLVLNNTNVAQILAAHGKQEYARVKEDLPPWVLFFNIAAYDFLPEERLKGQTEDMQELAQRLGINPVKALGNITAETFLKLIQRPSTEPYWKLNYKGGCQDIFFLTIFDKLPNLIQEMYTAAEAAGYPGSDLGIYLQPIVQGVNCHCEFNLFFDRRDPAKAKSIKDLSISATKKLLSQGAFFSRPYSEFTGLIMNQDAATVSALKKVKAIADPLGIMNPGKLCF